MRKRGFPLLCPTAGFACLVFVLGVMWYSAASQNNAAVYLLLFCLTSVFLVSIPHTLLNLGGLKTTAQSVKPTFAGQEVSLPVEITNQSRAQRHAIALSLPQAGGDPQRIETIPAGKSARVTVRFPAPVRGEHEIGRLCLTSLYPLGFLRASRRISTSQRYLVYPKPAGDPSLPIGSARSTRNRPWSELGEGDDFAGVRTYLPGESQRHIDWKAVARGQALMTKQFSAETNDVLYLDFADVRKDPEARLSQLTLWVIEAERARRPYGLRLPATQIPPSIGEQHFHRCLRALALSS
jgi:uncharacterized protein (DUF58 family)